jgi:2,4-dienoyl-CoA reductase-like NADH-dependent reductase (Old Yellow Enzyme family)/thioredoxin reductase
MAGDALDTLFEPFTINAMTLKNRLVHAPMLSRFTSADGEVTERLITYLTERARGGVGMITTETMTVDWASGSGSVPSIRIDEDRFIPGLNELAEAVHREGAKIVAQFTHPGRQSDHRARNVRAGVRTELGPPWSSSDVTSRAIGDRPRPMTADEIDWMVERFAAAALRARDSGFDGIELHVVHGYLLHQFFSPQTNRRTDEYGGSMENRARFARRVVRRVREVLGQDFPLLCRIAGEERVPGGAPLEENVQLGRWLAEDGIDAFSVSAGTYEAREWIYTPAGVEPGSLVPLARAMKDGAGRPVLGVSRLGSDLRAATRFVADGSLDLVVMGRTQLADSHTVAKARAGRWADIRPCIACGECAREFIAKQKRMQCVVNPELSHEFKRPLTRSREQRRIAVVGGGPAGLEAARAAALRGHVVTVFESSAELGGQLRHAAVPSFHAKEMRQLAAYWEHSLTELGVEIRQGEYATPSMILECRPDQVLLAVGAEWQVPEPALKLFGDVPTAHEALLDSSGLGERVLVVGGTEAGLNSALALAGTGHAVTLVERAEVIGAEISDLMRDHMLRLAVAAGVRLCTAAETVSAERQAGEWTVTVLQDGVTVSLTADSVVLTASPAAPDLREWSGLPSVSVLGTAREPSGRLYRATQDGFWATADNQKGYPA